MAPPAPESMSLAPAFLAHRYSVSRDAIVFVEADREVRRRVPFLIDRELDTSRPLVFDRAQVLGVCPPLAPTHFVFHSAFCCSTLLANAFDLPGVATSFKEPVILNDLIGWRRRGQAERLPQVIGDLMRLLARPFEDGEAVVIKPSNLVNELAPLLMAQLPQARAIFIEAPLAEFVTSIAGKGLEGRSWVRELFTHLVQADLIHLGIEPKDYLMLTDLQVAAIGWVAQRQLFAELTRRAPDRYRWITSRALLAEPMRAMDAAYRFYRIEIEPSELERQVASVFARNSKDGRSFSSQDRAADQAAAASGNADEIAKATAWAERLAENVRLPLHAINPLLPAS